MLQETNEFVINSPTTLSQKYWITNGAVHAKHVVVFAQVDELLEKKACSQCVELRNNNFGSERLEKRFCTVQVLHCNSSMNSKKI